MLAKKKGAFKGGRLDDFVAAAEAEAKYGPSRYAAQTQDAWTIEVAADRTERDRVEAQRQRSVRGYEAQKTQLLQDHAFLSLLGVAATWSFLSLKCVESYAVGAALGGFYLFLLQRSAEGTLA